MMPAYRLRIVREEKERMVYRSTDSIRAVYCQIQSILAQGGYVTTLTDREFAGHVVGRIQSIREITGRVKLPSDLLGNLMKRISVYDYISGFIDAASVALTVKSIRTGLCAVVDSIIRGRSSAGILEDYDKAIREVLK